MTRMDADANTLAGLVLAGGRSRRMGRDKALLDVGGEALVVRQVRLLRECGAGEVWVSVGADGSGPVADQVEGLGRIVRDRIADAGPAEGLEQVLEGTRSDWLVVLAVDLPGLDTGFLRELVSRVDVGTGVVPVTAAGLEPLCAVYPVPHARDEIRRWQPGTERSPRRLAATGLTAGWMREWRCEGPGAERLRNWNAPGDWPGA